jgi:hypothetical protein
MKLNRDILRFIGQFADSLFMVDSFSVSAVRSLLRYGYDSGHAALPARMLFPGLRFAIAALPVARDQVEGVIVTRGGGLARQVHVGGAEHL